MLIIYLAHVHTEIAVTIVTTISFVRENLNIIVSLYNKWPAALSRREPHATIQIASMGTKQCVNMVQNASTGKMVSLASTPKHHAFIAPSLAGKGFCRHGGGMYICFVHFAGY
jgi:hypothetical protein